MIIHNEALNSVQNLTPKKRNNNQLLEAVVTVKDYLTQVLSSKKQLEYSKDCDMEQPGSYCSLMLKPELNGYSVCK